MLVKPPEFEPRYPGKSNRARQQPPGPGVYPFHPGASSLILGLYHLSYQTSLTSQ